METKRGRALRGEKDQEGVVVNEDGGLSGAADDVQFTVSSEQDRIRASGFRQMLTT